MKSLLAPLILIPALALAADPPKAQSTPVPKAQSTPVPKAQSTPTKPDAAVVEKTYMWQPFETVLEPKKDFEVCTKMEKGETRRYHWKADNAVDFNVHYHRGKEVTYPVKRTSMRADGGSFTAKEADEYCWMWTAKNAKVKLDGRLENPKEPR
jgi:hypothetical protein